MISTPGHMTSTPSRMTSTPARMTISLSILLLLTLAFGIAGAIGASQRTSLVGSVRTDSGPLALDAEFLYRSLSDADATAGGEFLFASQQAPDPTDLASLRARYLDDIETASEDLTVVSASRADPTALRQLAAGIPVYAGLVETARADSQLGLPLGAAYLREASNQMRTLLLPAAQSLYTAETAQLAADRSNAGEFPWFAIPLGLITLVGLIRAQRTMSRRTHRIFSPGLVIATLTVVIALGWITVSSTGDAIHLHTSAANGSQRVDVFADARIDLLRARADEELTLIARGNDPSFDSDFKTMMTDLRGLLATASPSSTNPGSIAAIQSRLAAWQHEDTAMRIANAAGNYQIAVTDTVGPTNGDAPALFASVDDAVSTAIDESNAEFQAQSADASDALAGLAIGVGLLIAVALIGLIVGFQRRIAEFR
jgi:hypothetical protein